VRARAKVNLALVVGPLRGDGKHEVVTVLQEIDFHDDVDLEPADRLTVVGYPEDTLVAGALRELAAAAGVEPAWAVRIAKRVPVAAGLGGGSSDAAAALALANASLPQALPADELQRLAARIGADVPFFLVGGACLGTGDGSELAPLDLPADYALLLALPIGEAKAATAEVYGAFDERGGAEGFAARRDALLAALAKIESARDLAALPANDLASSPLSAELKRLAAFRADVSGAGPVVYGLFEGRHEAERAAGALVGRARTWLVDPVARA
jgi:4-diphosphocytidyl-2-C-methyl-D-erythritol kinase